MSGRTTLRRWLIAFASFGLVLALAELSALLLVVHAETHASSFEASQRILSESHVPLLRVMIFTWPSSILLLATNGAEKTPQAFGMAMVAVLINAAFYAAIGWALWGMRRLVRR